VILVVQQQQQPTRSFSQSKSRVEEVEEDKEAEEIEDREAI
jgi:hypothetical protein